MRKRTVLTWFGVLMVVALLYVSDVEIWLGDKEDTIFYFNRDGIGNEEIENVGDVEP